MSTRVPLPLWVDVALLPLLNVLLAFIIGGLIVLAVGQNPLEALNIMLTGAFGSGRGFGYTLYYTTDFIFAGLAVSLAYHAGMFNIGPEGQAYLGGLGVILIALPLNGMHWALMFPLFVIAGATFGALWALIPGMLQAKRGSHIVITTILFNLIATPLMNFIISRILRPAGVQSDESAPIEMISRIPRLRDFIPFFGSAPANLTIFVAIGTLVGFYWLVWRSKFGYAMRALGHNPTATRYAGISISKMIIITMVISGALAGLVAVNHTGGAAEGRLILNFVGGAGFVGIAVAFMGRAHPVGVGLAAILFGALTQGGLELAFSMPSVTRDMIVTIQAMVILFTGAMGDMLRIPLERLFGRFSSAEAK